MFWHTKFQVSYDEDIIIREKRLREIFLAGSFSYDNINQTGFWEQFFFQHPEVKYYLEVILNKSYYGVLFFCEVL